MVISSRYTIEIPPVDILSYIFDPSTNSTGLPSFVNAGNPSQNFTKPELEIVVKKIGSGLRKACGVQPEDVVLISVFTGANPSYTVSELTHQLNICSAKVIFTDRERLPAVLEAAKAARTPCEKIFLIDGGEVSSSRAGVPVLSELLNHGELQWERVNDLETVSQRTAVLNFSSGTTGPPKACMVTHHNLVANAEQSMHLDELARVRNSDPTYATRDVHCAYVPLYHAMGLFQFCVLNVRRDCTTVIMSKFSLPSLLEAIQQCRVTYLLVVPPVAVLLIKSPLLSGYDLSSVKFLLCGAAPLGKETSTQLENVFSANGARTRQGWGMTEATCSVTLFAPDEYDPTHAGVGYLVPNMQAKIVTDDGNEVGYGEEGEALIRGPNVFRGYHRNEVATKEAWTEDGWLKTGDYVVVQPNGLFSVVDRKKELIKVKGFQVAPSELEAHLLECDEVKDCAVIRVERDGQEHPQAHIVPTVEKPTATSILRFMEGRLSAHKRLTGGVVFTEAIPKSPSGKILRRMIRDPYSSTKIKERSHL
ncbi:acetyl-CoA synthetase-like protein [Mytilinidion resinicola]|uniref:Acetyl-CoA synthetase-like protein n=1 Tax=Mytilinidion resinicola TaxID=574789 RepID=A0A6A6Z385_9PEZI|nr:acetyl-CoA synthetase-like protein [Mytilinidion resinicola]KAF2815566.1 acetyl-CoA synthetase-like protein [Mytilinidion resinicola]